MAPKKKTTKKTSAKKTTVKKAPAKKTTASKKPTKKPARKAKTVDEKVSDEIIEEKPPKKSLKKPSKKETVSIEDSAETDQGKGAIKATSGKKKKNYSEIDKDILQLLNSASGNSMYAEEIQFTLDVPPEDVKRSIKRLESKVPPKIRSKLVMQQSRWIIQVSKVEDYGLDLSSAKKTPKLVWETLNDLPCFICPYNQKCNDGQELYNPTCCPYLSDWLLSTLNGEVPFQGNPFHQNYELKKKKEEEEAEVIPDFDV